MEEQNKLDLPYDERILNFKLYTSIEEEKKLQNPDYVETISYRGKSCDVYIDDPGQQYYTVLDGQDIGFGSYNSLYRDDIKYIIDHKLDTIVYIEEYPGSKLTWFENGGHRDIALYYRLRLCRVYFNNTVKQILTEEKRQELIEDAKTVLDTIVKKTI